MISVLQQTSPSVSIGVAYNKSNYEVKHTEERLLRLLQHGFIDVFGPRQGSHMFLEKSLQDTDFMVL